ncbi:MAG: hypothetical protein Q8N60_04240, partial [Candidatus Diapherotrites archaeon]|nr:hypothetical protein [Candidatus Diapherotrites archaeon]
SAIDSGRVSALQHYLSKGGVLHVVTSDADWPRMLYPTKKQLRKRIDDLRSLREQYASRLADWRKKFNDASSYRVVQSIKKLKEPLFWRHLAKCAIDRDYKTDSEKVHLPIDLVADKRWQPIVRVFLEDIDYRKQLVQTVDESIVYKNNKRVAQYANLLQQFRMEQSNRMVEGLQQKIADLDADIAAIQEIARWASF